MPRVEMFPNVRKSAEPPIQTVAVGSARNSGRWKEFTQKREGGRAGDGTGARDGTGGRRRQGSRSGSASLRGSSSADPALLDLVQQGLVAHAENLRGLAAIPVHLPERLLDRRALGFHRRRLCDRSQRATAFCRRIAILAAVLSARVWR